VSDEIEALRARVAELERRVAELFEQTGSADWEADAHDAPAVSERVRSLIQAGKPREAVKRYQEETGADMGEAMAALGQAARELRAD
jgi:hypothetical protein